MNRSASLAAAMVLAGASAAFAAEWKLECPAQLATTQIVVGNLPQGWSAVGRTTSSVRDAPPGTSVTGTTPPVSISVFDGPPVEMADLVPDDPQAKAQQWTFGSKRSRDIYVVCNYADTRMKFAHKVPAEVASCTANPATGPVTGVVCR